MIIFSDARVFVTKLDFSSSHSSSESVNPVSAAGNQGQGTKEGLIIAAVGGLHHIPPRAPSDQAAKTVTHAGRLTGLAILSNIQEVLPRSFDTKPF